MNNTDNLCPQCAKECNGKCSQDQASSIIKAARQSVKKQKQEEAKRLLIGWSKPDKFSIRPGDMLLFFVRKSRIGFNKRVKVYQVKTDTDGRQILFCLTRNIAVLMGLANSREAEERAFNQGMLTDDGIPELSHYLAVKLFGNEIAKQLPFIAETIEM